MAHGPFGKYLRWTLLSPKLLGQSSSISADPMKRAFSAKEAHIIHMRDEKVTEAGSDRPNADDLTVHAANN